MSPLDLLPLPYRLGIVAFLLAVGAAGIVGYGHHKHTEGVADGKAIVQAQFDAYKAQVQQQAIAARDAAIKAQQAAAAESQRRLADQQEASHVHEKQLDQARADAAAAAGSVARLQHRIAQLAAAAGSGGPAGDHPAASPVGSPAARVGEVAGQCVGALAQLRDVARRGQLAGDECAARYDALRAAKP
jgi:Protein of unknown function (DUF2514)